MKTGSRQMKKQFFFIFLCLMMCYAETCRAVASMHGQLTANVKLRRSPGFNGKTLTIIEKGETVLVKDDVGDWYQIVLEKKDYGFRGWVYGKYVKTIDIEKEKTAPPLVSRIIETNLKKTRLDVPLEIKEENKPDLLHESREDLYLQEFFPAIKNVEKIQPNKRGKAEITPQSVSLVKSLGGKKGKTKDTLHKTQKNTPIEWHIPVRKENKKNQSPIFKSIGVLTKHHGIADFVKLLLRLSTVVLSCLALFLSCKALGLTKKGPTMKAIASSFVAFFIR